MTVQYLGNGNPDGQSLGSATTEKVSLYGVTPITQRAAAAQATSLIVAWMLEVSNTLTALGAWKGSA
jgi:hypothetical protein